MAVKVNILGSCISRVSMLNGNLNRHGIADDDIELCYYLDKQNIVCAMTPAVFSAEDIESLSEKELWMDNKQLGLRCLKQCLCKSTVDMLLDSDAEWLIIDLYDMHCDMFIFREGMFSTYQHEFFRTGLYRKYKDEIFICNLMQNPKAFYYGYVDLFFEKILKKYDSNHIILNCFRSCTYYLSKQGTVQSGTLKGPWRSNNEYNPALYELEEYIIRKYNPYVIDLSKYFFVSENLWNNDLDGAHFEEKYYQETFKQIKRIIKGETKEKYFSNPNFFNDEDNSKEKAYALDIENALLMLHYLINKDDILWMNILDKLNIHAPDDKRVQQYMKMLSDALD